MLKLSFVGDIACDRPFLKAAKKDGKYDFKGAFRTESVFAGSDYVVGNLESCFGGANFGKKPYHYSAPDSLCDAMRDVGFNIVSTANNHCLDEGVEGLRRTLDVLDEYGIAYTGTFRSKDDSRYLIVEKNGVKIAFYSLTYSVNQTYEASLCKDPIQHVNLLNCSNKKFSQNALIRWWQTYLRPELAKSYLRLKAGTIIPMRVDKLTDGSIKEEWLATVDSHIKEARSKADVLVILLHIGGQFNTEPGDYSKFMVDRLCGLGADLIIGHHPHTLQRIERRGETIVAYSLGGYCLSPSADYLVRESLPEYSAALHVVIGEDKKISDCSCTILKSVEDDDLFVHVVEAEKDSDKVQIVRDRLGTDVRIV